MPIILVAIWTLLPVIVRVENGVGGEGQGSGPERSCVAVVLACLQDSEGAGMLLMVIAVSMFVTVGRRRAAGKPGGSLSK